MQCFDWNWNWRFQDTRTSFTHLLNDSQTLAATAQRDISDTNLPRHNASTQCHNGTPMFKWHLSNLTASLPLCTLLAKLPCYRVHAHTIRKHGDLNRTCGKLFCGRMWIPKQLPFLFVKILLQRGISFDFIVRFLFFVLPSTHRPTASLVVDKVVSPHPRR